MSGVAGVCTLPQNIKYKLFTTDNIGCGTLLVCYPRIHCIHHTADYSILLLLYCEIGTEDYLKDAEYCQRLLSGNNVSKG